VPGRGPNSAQKSSTAEAFDGRSLIHLDPKIAAIGDRSPRFQGGGRSEDPPVGRPPDDPERSPFGLPNHPEHSVSRCSGHPHRGDSSRIGFRRSVPTVRGASGSPLWRSGKVDRGHGHRKPRGELIFAIRCPLFAERSHDLRPRARETPREPRPKPQPSRGSRTTLPGKRAPGLMAIRKNRSLSFPGLKFPPCR